MVLEEHYKNQASGALTNKFGGIKLALHRVIVVGDKELAGVLQETYRGRLDVMEAESYSPTLSQEFKDRTLFLVSGDLSDQALMNLGFQAVISGFTNLCYLAGTTRSVAELTRVVELTRFICYERKSGGALALVEYTKYLQSKLIRDAEAAGKAPGKEVDL